MPLHDIRAYSEDAVLKDGGSVLLRAAEPPDQPGIGELFGRLSTTSSRYRFFATRTDIPESEIQHVTRFDADHASIVALLRDGNAERIIGVAQLAAVAPEPGTPGEEQVRRAEVAVAVLDEHQGRGIGTLLLERLAGLARDAGFEELEADVLADNQKMLEVFDSSGLGLRLAQGEGVVHVVFPTKESEKLLLASFSRERQAARESVRVFFEPGSVAVVGASHREGTIGRAIVDNLISAGFRGPIYPVNPSATEIAGLPAHASLGAIGKPVDLVVVAVPAPLVEAVVMDAAAAHARGVVVISSGFAEVSKEGRDAEDRLRRLVRSYGMRLVGPNCMGVLNASPSVSLNATFAPTWPPSGNVSMLSQSGALGIAMLDYAERLNIGLAGFISVGNKADVSSNDVLSYWGDDPNTGVIVLYLESFGNARTFARLAPDVARKKPIVAVKSGRSAAGTRAASSHSAALASLDVGIDALFAQAGVIRTNTLEELFDVVALLSMQPAPRGPRVGVVTNAGGPGILLADACEAHGLSLPTLAPETVARLREILPPQAGLSNPVDMIASATPGQYERAIELVGADPFVDALIVIYIPPLVTKPAEIAHAIASGAGRVPADKPIASVFLSSKGAPPALSKGPRGKIPSYSFPENAAMALATALRHARWRERPRGTTVSIELREERAIRRIVEKSLASAPDERTWISTEDLATILGLAGVPFATLTTCPPEPAAAEEASTRLAGFPVVLKAVAPGLLHKTDVGGVVVGLESKEVVRRAAQTMLERLRATGYELSAFLLQRQIEGGIEAFIGVTSDPSLGPIVMTGLGGIHVELLGDVACRLPPLSDVDAREMLDSIRAKKLFDGFRGSPPGDREALVSVITRISALVEIVPELTELDLNPVKVLLPGRGAVVVDGRMRLQRRG